MAILQAKGRFVRLFFTEAGKYATAFAALVCCLAAGFSVTTALYAQLAAMTCWNVALFVFYHREFVNLRLAAKAGLQLIRAKPAADARLISLGVILPGALEHLDKIILGATHGLAIVGIYTLGFSTGRFAYNAFKPATYIFYRRFVHQMPGWGALRGVFLGFTLLGAMAAGGLYFGIQLLPPLQPFAAAFGVTAILFASYGVGMVDAIYVQAYSINKHGDARHVLIANTAAGALCLGWFAYAARFDAPTAMLLFALHYPLRHAASVSILWMLAKRSSASVSAPES
jgi:hypothetical protein